MSNNNIHPEIALSSATCYASFNFADISKTHLAEIIRLSYQFINFRTSSRMFGLTKFGSGCKFKYRIPKEHSRIQSNAYKEIFLKLGPEKAHIITGKIVLRPI